MNFLVLGSSGGLGRAISERLAQLGHNLLLIASDERDLLAHSSHLKLVYSINVDYISCCVNYNNNWFDYVSKKIDDFGKIDGLFLPIGFSTDIDRGIIAEDILRQIIESNFVAIALLISHILPQFIESNSGYIIGFGSVASIRGRKNNIIYSAAKRSLLSYFESLCHLTAQTEIKVHFYQMGYIDTQQSFGKKLLFPKCQPNQVAKMVCKNLDRSSSITYYPNFWSIISIIIKALPWMIFKKLNF